MKKSYFTILMPVFFSLYSNISVGQEVSQKEPTTQNEEHINTQAYQEQSISRIITKKDSLLQKYGSFEAARKAGALVRPKSVMIEEKVK